jgi:hypothetical protein
MVGMLSGIKFFEDCSTEGGAICGTAEGAAVTATSGLLVGTEAIC